MPHFRYHSKVNKAAYLMLKEKLDQEYFPKKAKLWFYGNIFSPDVAHSFKFLSGYEKFNHMNSEKHEGSLVQSLKQYKKLVRKLKSKKGAFNAAWLGHFIADSLEPMHQTEWRDKNKKTRKQKRNFHLWVEHNTIKLNFQAGNLVEIKEPLDTYLKKKTKEIKKLNIKQYNKKDKERILKIYEQHIIPAQIEAVASIWYKSVCEANKAN